MVLIFNGDKTMAHLREKFEEDFPFLTLQFYYPKANDGFASAEPKKMEPEVPLRMVNSTLMETVIAFEPSTKTGVLEQQILQKCGVPVRVLRCRGQEWIATFADDNLTLEEQNQMGQFAMEQWVQSDSA